MAGIVEWWVLGVLFTCSMLFVATASILCLVCAQPEDTPDNTKVSDRGGRRDSSELLLITVGVADTPTDTSGGVVWCAAPSDIFDGVLRRGGGGGGVWGGGVGGIYPSSSAGPQAEATPRHAIPILCSAGPQTDARPHRGGGDGGDGGGGGGGEEGRQSNEASVPVAIDVADIEVAGLSALSPTRSYTWLAPASQV